MNGAILWRVAWKEYRQQRGFWISMAVLAVLTQAGVLAWHSYHMQALPAAALVVIALGASALYALGCGATLFATEHEAGTYDFQRVLPISARQLFAGKLSFALLSTLVLTGLLWLVAWLLPSGRLAGLNQHAQLGASGLLVAAEFLVWGMFFSLVSRHPLRAAVLAVAAASLGVHLIVPLLTMAPGSQAFAFETYLQGFLQRWTVVALLLAVDIWLGNRWFRDSLLSLAPLPGTADRPAVRNEQTEAERAPPWVGLGRLVWQQWWQTARMLGTLSGVFGLLLVLLFLGAASASDIEPLMAALLSVALAALMGSSVFLADHQGQSYRFFADQGISARVVWVSRQLVGLGATLCWTALVLLLLAVQPARVWSVGPGELEFGEVLVGVLGMSLLAYAGGQLSSMLIRSGIVAAVVGLSLTVVLYGWLALMYLLQINLFWSVGPIPLVLLFVTWLRAPDWMLDRTAWRAWLRVSLALGLPLLVLFASVVLYRVYEIPVQDPGFSPQQYAQPRTAEQWTTAEMYQSAWQRIVPQQGPSVPPPQAPSGMAYDGMGGPMAEVPEEAPLLPGEDAPQEQPDELPEEPAAELTLEEVAWVEANQPVLDLALQASRRPECAFSNPDQPPRALNRAGMLGSLLTTAGRLRQTEGRLEESLEFYRAVLRFSAHLRQLGGSWEHHHADSIETLAYEHLPSWAAQPGQSPESVRAAAGWLEQFQQAIPPRADAIKTDYHVTHRFLQADPDVMSWMGIAEQDLRTFVLITRLAVWERVRAERLLDVVTRSELRRMAVTDQYLERGKPVSGIAAEDWDEQARVWLATTPILRLGSMMLGGSGAHLAAQEAHMQTRRRAVQLQLALTAWQLEHGELPARLEELVKADDVGPLPPDPYTGRPFHYFPTGLPLALPANELHWRQPPDKEMLPPGTPLLWSAGPFLQFVAPHEEPRQMHRLSPGAPHWLHDLSIWQAGWAFPLPEPAGRADE